MRLALFVAAGSLIAVPLAAGSTLAPSAVLAPQEDAAKVAEWDQKLKDAGQDVTKLFALAEWCKENKLRNQERDTYKRVLEIDANNEQAHKALRHHFYDGQWFETYAALSVYKRDEAKRMEEKGLTKVGEEWVAIADAPFLRMGWVKCDDGKYRSQASIDRTAKEKELTAAGWQQQYSEWVAPEDFAKWEQGLFKCGEEWLEKEKANEYHSQVGRWWIMPGDSIVVRTTCDHDTATWVRFHADQVVPQLVRLFGKQPDTKPNVTVLSSLTQYNLYAGGDQAAGLPATEANGYSSCHFAYFAELQLDFAVTPPEPNQGGVAFWDKNDSALAPFGEYAVRHAAALSWCEAIDPSWDAVSRVMSSPGDGQFPEPAFWAEKRIPRWMRYGAASYVERYAPIAGAENPWANRTWAVNNLATHGEPNSFEAIFALQLDPTDGTGKLLSEAGLVISFILDGECKPVVDAQQKLKAMIQRGQDTQEAVKELQQALVDNRAAFDTYVKTIKG